MTKQSSGETTIAAQATAQGSGAIAIVRLSGPASLDIVRRIFRPASGRIDEFVPWRLRHGRVVDAEGEPLDDVLCVFMPAPHTYTGEDCAEIQCHGGQAVVNQILSSCIAAGAEPARRGEFSYRAFLNGRMDLSQAEAVAEMISAPGREAMRLSLKRLDGTLGRRVDEVRESLEECRVQISLAVDFPDDEVEPLPREHFAGVVQNAVSSLGELLTGARRARLVEKGAHVVLAGEVNAGKSSLMNALLGRSRALVTSIPGTTRDFLEEDLELNGLPVRIVDTAGLRSASDPVEALGIESSRRQIGDADCLLFVVDGAANTDPEAYLRSDVFLDAWKKSGTCPFLLVWNKTDLRPAPSFLKDWKGDGSRPAACVAISAEKSVNLDALAERVRSFLIKDAPQGEDVAPNIRQTTSLEAALNELNGLLGDIADGLPYDVLSVRLDLACVHLRDVVGLGTSQDVLNRVFSSFCIGK